MLSEETKQELILSLLGLNREKQTEQFWEIGKSYHIRSVTMDFAGKLKSISDKEIVLSDSSWVADSGRFNEYLKDTSKVNENEPYKNDVLVNRSAITDATVIEAAFSGVK